MPRGYPLSKRPSILLASCVAQLREHARALGHEPGRGHCSPTIRGVECVRWYRCACEICGAVIALRTARVGKGFRSMPLGECANENDYRHGWGI